MERVDATHSGRTWRVGSPAVGNKRTDGQYQIPRQLPKAGRIATIVANLIMALACGANSPSDQTPSQRDFFPSPDRSQVQIINDETTVGLTDGKAISAYRQGYAHMRTAAWFSAIAAYDQAIRIQPAVSDLYEARGTAYMYAGRHDQALADYSSAIKLNPNDAGHWRRRAHAYTIAPTPQPERSIEDATRAIELAPPPHSVNFHRH